MITTDKDAVERATIMLDLIRNRNHENIWDVVEKIGEAEEKRGELIGKYLDMAKQFYDDMKPE